MHHARELLDEVKRLRDEVKELAAAYRDATDRYHQATAELLDHGATGGLTTQKIADELGMTRSRLYALREKARRQTPTGAGPPDPHEGEQ